MKKLLFPLLIALITVTGCHKKSDDPPPNYAVSGTVTGVLPNLDITLRNTDTLVEMIVTSVDGKYVFGNLSAGNYLVTPVPVPGHSMTPLEYVFEVPSIGMDVMDFDVTSPAPDPEYSADDGYDECE